MGLATREAPGNFLMIIVYFCFTTYVKKIFAKMLQSQQMLCLRFQSKTIKHVLWSPSFVKQDSITEAFLYILLNVFAIERLHLACSLILT